jgi:hypothetical protein
VNVFCALSKGKVYGPFFFMEKAITGIVYLDMLEQFLIPQLDEDDQEGHIHFQQDGKQCASTSTPASKVGGLCMSPFEVVKLFLKRGVLSLFYVHITK